MFAFAFRVAAKRKSSRACASPFALAKRRLEAPIERLPQSNSVWTNPAAPLEADPKETPLGVASTPSRSTRRNRTAPTTTRTYPHTPRACVHHSTHHPPFPPSLSTPSNSARIVESRVLRTSRAGRGRCVPPDARAPPLDTTSRTSRARTTRNARGDRPASSSFASHLRGRRRVRANRYEVTNQIEYSYATNRVTLSRGSSMRSL